MADSQKYGRTANLFDDEIESGFYNDNGELVPDTTTSHSTTYIPVDGTTYTISGLWTSTTNFAVYEWDNNKNWLRRSNRQVPASSTLTFSIGSDTAFFTLQIKTEHGNIMLNTGSTALPYQPYNAWVHSLRKLTTATEAVENPLYSDGSPITAYTIKGNTVQNGTPTPSNPVEVNGVGERTENLFDKNTMTANAYLSNIDGQYLSSTGQSYSCIIKIKPNTSYRVRTASQTMRIAFFTRYPQPNDIPTAYYNHDSWDSYSPRAFIETSGNTNTYMVVFCYNNSREYADGKTVDEIMSTVMISEGAEMAVPYEPYGYKIPISSGQQTTNIYLGSTQTLRQVKKLVLTGDESGWVMSGTGFYYNLTLSDNPRERDVVMSTHFVTTHEGILPLGTFRFGGSIEAPTNPLVFNYDNGTIGLEAFKSWLASQYANGTPVIVWFIPTTAETAAVNEPLMKIGTYADTLSNATAIPTTDGANSITVDTSVQPSEFTATWTGWHDSSVKEYVGGHTVNLFDDTNVINVTGLGDRYGVILPSGTYSIYNDTDNTVNYGTNNWTGRFSACAAHSTATINLNVGSGGAVGGFFMALNSASQGGCTIVEGSTPPDHYIPYYTWVDD